MNCPGSVNAQAGLPDETSFFAAEGTAFHEVAAHCLEYGLSPYDFVGRTIPADGYEFEFTREWADFMQPGLDRVYELASGPNVVLIAERRVDLGPWLGKGNFGTADVIIIDLDRWQVTVFDWKFGQGKAVYPEWNVQIIAYLLGAWRDHGAKLFPDADDRDITARMIIYQPRIPDAGGEWEAQLSDLLSYVRNEVRPKAIATLDPDAPRVPGEKQCFFCKAKPDCRALAAANLEKAQLKFSDLDEYRPALPDVASLTPEERSAIHLHSDLFKSWLDAVSESLRIDATHGRPTPFLKLVNGRLGSRYWYDEEVAAKRLTARLGERAYEKKLLSPAQAEKLLREDEFATVTKGNVGQSPAKPSLVPEHDKRPAKKSYVERFKNWDAPDNE